MANPENTSSSIGRIIEEVEPTEGRALDRLRPSTLNTRLDKMLKNAAFTPTLTMQFETEHNGDWGNAHDAKSYSSLENNNTIITFSTVTEGAVPLPTCEEVFRHIKNNPEFKAMVENALARKMPTEKPGKSWEVIKPTIPIYVPIASTQIDFIGLTHDHFRGLYLTATLDDNGNVQIDNATLIDSRSKFSTSARTFPTDKIEQDLKSSFPKCTFQSIYTGHQSELALDNDSCGYRAVSYGIQIAKRGALFVNELIDDVRCRTGIFYSLLSWMQLKINPHETAPKKAEEVPKVEEEKDRPATPPSPKKQETKEPSAEKEDFEELNKGSSPSWKSGPGSG